MRCAILSNPRGRGLQCTRPLEDAKENNFIRVTTGQWLMVVERRRTAPMDGDVLPYRHSCVPYVDELSTRSAEWHPSLASIVYSRGKYDQVVLVYKYVDNDEWACSPPGRQHDLMIWSCSVIAEPNIHDITIGKYYLSTLPYET